MTNLNPVFAASGSDGHVKTDIPDTATPVRDMPEAVFVAPNGDIYVSGESGLSAAMTTYQNHLDLVRYTADGVLDTTFGTNGIAQIESLSGYRYSAGGMSMTADGKLVMAGSLISDNGKSTIVVAMLNADGTPDASFGIDGVAKITVSAKNMAYGADVAVQPDGKLVLTGTTIDHTGNGFDLVAARLNPDGSLDKTFSGDGIVITNIYGTYGDDFGRSVSIQSDGKIYIQGSADLDTKSEEVTYLANGSLDTSFGTGGSLWYANNGVFTWLQTVDWQGQNKVTVGRPLATESGDFLLTRFNTDGSLDTTFGVANTLNATPTFTEGGAAVVLDSTISVYDAELVAAGNYSGASITLARHGGANAEDVFSASGNLSFTGGNAVLSGVTVGTVSNAAGTLVITFNTNATQALVNETLSSIAYSNTSETPAPSVKIDWTLNDGSNGITVGNTTVTLIDVPAVDHPGVNDKPYAADQAVSVTEDIARAFTVADFGFADPDAGDTLQSITITALPTAGSLTINGAAVTVNQVIAAVDIAAGGLVFTPATNANGDAYATLNYKVSDGLLTSTSAYVMTINVTAVNDAPAITTTVADQAASSATAYSLTVAADAATDVDGSSSFYYAVSQLDGDWPVWLDFNQPTRELSGTPSVFDAATTNLRLSAIDDFGLTATDDFTLTVSVNGAPITGTTANETLTGTAGADGLDGRVGNHKMTGGAGNDTYLVDSSKDKVVEAKNAGTDEVRSSVTYTLGSTVENLILTGADNINGTGNGVTNKMTGNAGNNTLNGGAGVDTMAGLAGNDKYILDVLEDVVKEGVGAGTDTIELKAIATGSYTLPTNVENLKITGTGVINITGNASDNSITGNVKVNTLDGGAGADTIDGGGGNDIINGGTGNDTLIGGLGKDVLTGGAGSDIFVFNLKPSVANNDTITDFVAGTDTLQLSKAVFKAYPVAGDVPAGDFISGADLKVAADATDHFIFDTTGGNLYYDADGSGKVKAVLVGHLDNVTGTLSAGDLQIV